MTGTISMTGRYHRKGVWCWSTQQNICKLILIMRIWKKASNKAANNC